MQSLTGGRFTLGLGRGIAPMQDAFGIGRITTAQMEDFAGLMRRLFRGEVIIGHDGPAGSWPSVPVTLEPRQTGVVTTVPLAEHETNHPAEQVWMRNGPPVLGHQTRPEFAKGGLGRTVLLGHS